MKNISDERDKLCNDFSITWAAEESDWLLTNFLSRRNHGINVDFSNKDILTKKLCEISTMLIEKMMNVNLFLLMSLRVMDIIGQLKVKHLIQPIDFLKRLSLIDQLFLF